jgi:hypothetical protein
MGRVCDEAWHQLRSSTFFPSLDDEVNVRCRIAERVMAAVSCGERDAERLKALALDTLRF